MRASRLVNSVKIPLLLASGVLAVLTGSMTPASAMDTDIFAAQNTPGAAPNVLIVLDNTANWSRQNQHWPGGAQQGQAEVDAIKQAIQSLPGSINVGLMELETAHGSGGFVRFAVSPVGQAQGATAATNRTNFSNVLSSIVINGNGNESAPQTASFGDLMYDAYNYLAGTTPFAASGDVRASLADSRGYVSNYTQFKSPLSAGTSCGTTYIIFIGNAGTLKADSSANSAALTAVGGNASQLKLPVYTARAQTVQTNLGYSSACYTSAPTTTPTDYGSLCTSSYDSCSFSASDSTHDLPACTSGARYSVIATTPLTTTSIDSSTTTTNQGVTNSCYAASSNGPTSDTGTTPACPANTSVTAGNVTTATTYSCSYSMGTPAASSCSPVVNGPTAAPSTTQTANTASCYASNGNNAWNSSTGDLGGLSCPANPAPTTVNGVTTTTTNQCTYQGTAGASTAGCSANKSKWKVTMTVSPSVTTSTAQSKFPVTQTVTKTVRTITTIPGTQSAPMGNTMSCYASQASCSTSDYVCPAGATCSCSNPTTITGQCPAGARYQVVGNKAVTLETATGTFATDTAPYNADEWARFLHQVGVPIGGDTTQPRQTVSTYAIDVYKDQPDAGFSSLLGGMARAGGGKYFAALNQQDIMNALNSIFSEIQAVNSTFASAALPISATNRAQNANQVYIGMFRPDQTAHPRWFGNLKRYRIDDFNGSSDLAGADGKSAVSATTGFVTPCAVSWWTTDRGNFWYDTVSDQSRIFITQATSAGTAWQAAGDDSNFAKGGCGTTGMYSDSPDGPTVEKGAAAEMLRNQATRNVYTIAAGTNGASSLSTFGTSVPGISANSTVSANVVNFIAGQDVTGEIAGTPSTAMRPSIHGEVIHSRPLPIDYGGSTGVVVYYGAGDGVYHAVNGATGAELWSFVAPETYGQLQRLLDNSPLIQSPSPTPPGQTQVAGTTPKQFYFDGSTGQYQNADNSKVWIFPGMRRGGRMLYSFDVTTPTAPSLKWRVGCPNLADDTGCSTDMASIGQTWSTPQVANVNGYQQGGAAAPVVIVGGGYDGCEDADTTTPSCGSAKGAVVYVLDANTGAVIRSFATRRSVIADVSLVDTTFDGIVDAAYVADTGGNLYRLDFTGDDSTAWAMRRVAYTNVTPSNSFRKFEFQPALLPYQGKVYVAISSGDREHPLSSSYPYTTPVVNRFYVYLDDPARLTATDLDGPSMITASEPACSAPGVLPASQYVGWHMDLNSFGPGEQGVTSPIIIGGMVSFSTNRPVVSGASCTTSLGEARGYWVNLLNGSGAIGVAGTCGGTLSQTFIGGGLPPSPVAATVNVNGKSQTVVIGSIGRAGTGPTSAISAQEIRPPITNKRSRTYWRNNTDTR